MKIGIVKIELGIARIARLVIGIEIVLRLQ